MIHGVMVVLRSGLLVAQKGFEEEAKQQVLSALIGAAHGIAELLGAGKIKSVEMGDKSLYVISSTENPEIIVAVLADKGDASAPLIARKVILEAEKIIPPSIEVVTKEIEDPILRIIESSLMRRELPKAEEIKSLATLIYGSLSSDRIMEINSKFEEIQKREYENEKRMFLKLILREVSASPEIEAKLISECLDLAFNWQLYEAYELAMSLANYGKNYKDLAKLIAAKIGLMLSELPEKYARPQPEDIEKLLSEKVREEFEEFREFLFKYSQYIFHDKIQEYLSFLRTKYSSLVDRIFAFEDELLQKIALFLIFMRYRRFVFHEKFGEILKRIQNYEIIYEILYNRRKQSEIFDILYRVKSWSEVEKYFSESKLRYLEAQKRFDEVLKQKSLFYRIFMAGKRRAELIKAAHILLLRMETLLLASIAALEAYGLGIRDRDDIIREIYNIVLRDVYEIIKATPPTYYASYFNFYQFFLHSIYYRLFFATGEEYQRLLNQMLEISRVACNMFLKLYFRKRITFATLLRMIDSLEFTLAKAALKLNKVPLELLFFIKLISELPQELIDRINQSRTGWRAFYVNVLEILLPALKLIPMDVTKKNAIKRILSLSEEITEWHIYSGEFHRETIDDLADVIDVALDYLEKDECLRALEKIITYTNILVGDPKENKFEAAVFYERIGDLVIKYTQKFGLNKELAKKVINLLKIAREIWLEAGYKKKAEKIEKYLNILQG